MHRDDCTATGPLIGYYEWLEMEQNNREKQPTNWSQMVHSRSHSYISQFVMCTLIGSGVQQSTLHQLLPV